MRKINLDNNFFFLADCLNSCLKVITANPPILISLSTTLISRGARRGGGDGGSFHPPKPKKFAVEKWCYFSELYKMKKVREDEIENG